MGANEKHDATYHVGEYTPSNRQIRSSFTRGIRREVGLDQANRAFDRWLETVRAEAKAEALNEAASEIDRLDSDVEMYDENLNARQVSHWLRTRANQYKEQS